MNLDDAFVSTVEDLRRRSDLRASEYDAVQAAGLLRRLLLDTNPLWTQVNREFHFKPVLRWSGSHWDIAPPGEVSLVAPGLSLDHTILRTLLTIRNPKWDPRDDMEVDVWSGSIDDFLRFHVLEQGGRYEQDDEGIWRTFPGEFVTIKQLIRHFSDREGGVHYGLGRSTNPIIESIRHFADASLCRTIIACGRIVVRALETVAAAVMLRAHKWPEGLA